MIIPIDGLVISASRRTDLTAFFPEQFISSLEKYQPEQVHSVVIWTKNPNNLISHTALNSTLSQYSQLFLQLTITGLGGGELEPCIPVSENVLSLLPELIDFIGSPERIRVRFDPIVHLYKDGEICNMDCFYKIVSRIAPLGIKNVSASWMTMYGKVKHRIDVEGIKTAAFSRDDDLHELTTIASEFGMRLHFCCIPGLPVSKCIDGELLNRFHPSGKKAETKRAKGQRELCGCTESIDIGWYSQQCSGKCLYCYALP